LKGMPDEIVFVTPKKRGAKNSKHENVPLPSVGQLPRTCFVRTPKKGLGREFEQERESRVSGWVESKIGEETKGGQAVGGKKKGAKQWGCDGVHISRAPKGEKKYQSRMGNCQLQIGGGKNSRRSCQKKKKGYKRKHPFDESNSNSHNIKN